MADRYEPLPEDPEEGLDFSEAPVDWAALNNLDIFLQRVYRYWLEKGYAVTVTARVLNLAALAFTLYLSTALLLWVDYGKLHAECLRKDECNLWDVAFRRHPLSGGLSFWNVLSCGYLAMLAGYWVFAMVHLVHELRSLGEIHHFYSTALGLSERGVRAATWPEVAARLVAAQHSVRLCITRDLTEHDIVARIMRRENYLIGMLNKGVLALNVPLRGLEGHFLLTKTLEWNLHWCVLEPMFDANFRVCPAFLHDPAALRRRFRAMALLNAALSPFLLVFLVIYFFMKNAEELYHHPSSIGARRWSPAARWRLREFNELPHFLSHRLNAGHDAATRYCAQFPNHLASHAARFVAFVAGSFAALLIALTLVDERLLERDLVAGRQTVWWLALLGVMLAAARGLIIERGTAAFDPGLALLEVAAHTHHLPRHWRGRAHTLEVQEEFESLFRYRASLFLEELASVVLTPVLLWGALPQCASAILSFVERTTVHVEGVGDVCSLAAFDLQRHGNGHYGSPHTASKDARSRQGKMEKSLVSFAASYPGWEAPPDGQQLLSRVAATGLVGSHAAVASSSGDGPGNSWPPVHLYGLLTSQYPHLAKLYAAQYSTVQQQHAQPGPQRQKNAVDGSMFGSALCSAELFSYGGIAAGVLIGGAAAQSLLPGTPEGRVAAGQSLLQSFYEKQQASAVQPLQAAHGPPSHQQCSSELAAMGSRPSRNSSECAPPLTTAAMPYPPMD